MYVSPHGVKVFCEPGDTEVVLQVPKPVTDDVAADLLGIKDIIGQMAFFDPGADEGYDEMVSQLWWGAGTS
jgi:hypothetical protein